MSLDKRPIKLVLALATGALLIQPLPTLAFNFGDMMNPGKWVGGNRDRDDHYDDGDYGPNGYGVPYGPYGGYPYGGYGGYPYGGYGGYPYGGYAPWGAWAPPPAAAPSQVTTPAPAATPAPVQDSKTKEIESLKRRIEELESRQAPPPAYPPVPPAPPALERGGPASSPPSGLSNRGPQDSFSPSFRPMDKY